MRKLKYIGVITLIAFSIILILQSVWVAESYQLTAKQLKKELDDAFKTSFIQELSLRLAIPKEENKQPEGEEYIGELSDEDGTLFFPTEIVLQDFLIKKELPISLADLDSIFNSEIQKNDIQGEFIINRIQAETGEILETTNPNQLDKSKNAIYSDIYYIRADLSEGVQVVLVSPFRTVFMQMGLMIVLTALLILFVGFWLYYQYRSLRKEYRLRQMQADFSHALTHDMATPLQTIRQVNSLLQSGRLDDQPEKKAKLLDASQQQTIRLQNLTNRILTLAKSEQSKLTANRTTVNLPEMIQTILDKYSAASSSQKTIQITNHFDLDDQPITADPHLLEDAMTNLIDNAIKYSGSEVRIDISCRLAKDQLIIAVQDNGYGISARNQADIFKKFERGAAITRKEAKGFGLGLTHVKAVAEAHGGTVNLFSVEGEGSTFEVIIPQG